MLDNENDLTPAQRRLLTQCRTYGEWRVDGRSYRSLKVLERRGLVRIVPWRLGDPEGIGFEPVTADV